MVLVPCICFYIKSLLFSSSANSLGSHDTGDIYYLAFNFLGTDLSNFWEFSDASVAFDLFHPSFRWNRWLFF
jgi:hypothetical protein